MGRIIGAAEFKAKCLRILDEVERTGEPVTITKRGRPVAEIKPAPSQAEQKLFFGCMKGTVRIVDEDDDLINPAHNHRWDAEKGSWEPEE